MSGTCVAVGMVVGAIVGGGSSVYGIRRGNKKLLKAWQKQMKYVQMNYNYNQNALDIQEKGAYDAAVGELFSISLNANQNNATVEAAIAEQNFEGRTTKQIQRSISGQSERQKTAVKEAYGEEVYNIRSQKDALYVQMKAGVDQARDDLNHSFTKGLSAWMQVIDSAAKGAAIGAATGGAAGAAAGAGGGAGASGASAFGAKLSTFGSTFAKLYWGNGSSPGYATYGNLFSQFTNMGGTNQGYRYRRY